jgi:YD repeat-containing protein
MTQRVEGGVTWTQTFNAENGLASVSGGGQTWTFTYDGDGNHVKQVDPDGKITLFLGERQLHRCRYSW